VFLLNSRLSLFTVTQKSNKKQCSYHLSRHPFFQSYGANLPSSLKRILSNALGACSPSTCVGLRYGYTSSSLEVFLESLESTTSPCGSPSLLRVNASRDLPPDTSYKLGRRQPKPRLVYPPLSPRPDNGRYVVQEY